MINKPAELQPALHSVKDLSDVLRKLEECGGSKKIYVGNGAEGFG